MNYTTYGITGYLDCPNYGCPSRIRDTSSATRCTNTSCLNRVLKNTEYRVNEDTNMTDTKMEKVYEVEFMQYTDTLKDRVNHASENPVTTSYIDVGKEPFLVKESELDKYRRYGGGFRSVKFVGNMIV